MELLNGLDTAFLYLESDTVHYHVGLAAVFEERPQDGPSAYDSVYRLLETRIHLIPPFRRRLALPLGGLLPAAWVDDPNFTLADHVLRVPPFAELSNDTIETFAGEVMGRPLDRGKPLWEIHVLEGRDDRRMAMIAKVHHAAIDGISGIDLLANLVDMVRDAPEVVPPPAEDTAEATGPPEIVAAIQAGVGVVTGDAYRATTAIRDVAQRWWTQWSRLATDLLEDPPAPLLQSTPRTSLTKPVSDRRAISLASLPMDDLKCVQKSLGGTVNDVVLAVAGGALRTYLAAHDETPDAPLVAAVPVSLRSNDHLPTGGNQVSMMFVPLATDVDDARERYEAITAASRAAKRKESDLRPGEITSTMLSLVRPIAGNGLGRVASRFMATGRPTVPCNVIISNIPGPPFTMYAGGNAHDVGPSTRSDHRWRRRST